MDLIDILRQEYADYITTVPLKSSFVDAAPGSTYTGDRTARCRN